MLPHDGPASVGLQVKHVMRVPGQHSHADVEVRPLGVGHDLKALLSHGILLVTDWKERDWHRGGVGEAGLTQGGECDLCSLLDGLIQLEPDDSCHPRLRTLVPCSTRKPRRVVRGWLEHVTPTFYKYKILST
jgi:hypothetical protein